MTNNPYYTGKNSVDIWSNTAADGSGTPKQPLVDADGNPQIDVVSSALPTGAATSSLQSSGLQKSQIVGKTGVTSDVDFVGKIKVVQPFRTAGSTFSGTTIDANFWTSAVANNGTNTQVSSLMTMASSVTASGRAGLRTARSGRFIFFNPMVCRMAVRIPDTTIADNTRRWGAFTDSSGAPQDGFYFELSATGVLSVNGVRATTATIGVASGSFNGSVASYTVDTNVHAYEIHYFVMKVEFYIDGVLIHTATPTTANLSSTYSLPINFVTINGATGGESGVIEIFSANTVRLGLESTQPRSYFATAKTAETVLKRGAGDLHSLEVSNVTNNAAITIYDNTAASGTVIWASGAMGTQTQPFNIDLHQVAFETGLTLVIATAACNLLVIYE